MKVRGRESSPGDRLEAYPTMGLRSVERSLTLIRAAAVRRDDAK
jgi:hypothetical protein